MISTWRDAESYDAGATMPSAAASSRNRSGLGLAARPRPSPARAPSPARRAAAVSPPASVTWRAASSPRRVRRSRASPTLRACSRRAAWTTSARRSAAPGHDRLGELAALGRHREDVVGGVAVAAREVLVGLLRDALDARQLGGVDRLAERDLVRAARRVAGLALDEAVDGHLRHPPPGGELAAGDRDHPARRLVQLGLARDVDGLLRVAGGDQRPHARVGAGDVVGARGRWRSTRWWPSSR